MKFADRLKELRISKGLSQKELAKLMGVSSSTISMYEQDQREPSFEIEERIADYFNVDLDYLRGGSNSTTKIISGDAHLLLHIFGELDEVSRSALIGYARGLLDIQIMKKNGD